MEKRVAKITNLSARGGKHRVEKTPAKMQNASRVSLLHALLKLSDAMRYPTDAYELAVYLYDMPAVCKLKDEIDAYLIGVTCLCIGAKFWLGQLEDNNESAPTFKFMLKSFNIALDTFKEYELRVLVACDFRFPIHSLRELVLLELKRHTDYTLFDLKQLENFCRRSLMLQHHTTYQGKSDTIVKAIACLMYPNLHANDELSKEMDSNPVVMELFFDNSSIESPFC